MFKDKHIFLVIATSGRAIAQALKASGDAIAVVDGFADLDTRAATEVCIKVARTKFGLNANEVLRVINKLQSQHTFDGLFYDAALESNPDLLDSISISQVIGNSSHTLRQCKDPKVFFSILDQHAIPYPEVSFNYIQNPADSWLIKHVNSTGGIGISDYLAKSNFGENVYLQRNETHLARHVSCRWLRY